VKYPITLIAIATAATARAAATAIRRRRLNAQFSETGRSGLPKHIAHAMDRLDQPSLTARFELAAKVADVHPQSVA
jgi:hypothetical protein